MTVKGLDAYGAIAVNELGGYDFVCRYVSLQPGKCVTPSEAKGYLAAKKSLVLAYEDNAEDGLGGAAMGAEKAAIARPILAAIGWPANRPVHFAFDMPGYQQDLPAFVACAVAFANGINRPVAVYGDVDTCTYAHEHGVKYLWQFGEGQAPGVTILQGAPFTAPWGQPVDPDTAFADDYGQWPYIPPTPPAPKPTPEVDPDMAVITTDPNNNGKILLDTNSGIYYGFSSPATYDYWTKTLGVKVVAAPTTEVFAQLHQAGTI